MMAARTLRTNPLGLFADQPTPLLCDHKVSEHPRSGVRRRHHLHEAGDGSYVSALVYNALDRGGLRHPHGVRNSLATATFGPQ